MKRGLGIAAVVAALLIGGYLAWASTTGSWPFAAEPAPESKTYTNAQYGFELMYPASYAVREVPSAPLNVEFLAQPRGGFQVNVDQNPVDHGDCVTPLATKTVNGIDWSINAYTCGAGSDFDYTFAAITVHGGMAYTILTSGTTQDELDRILSSFKFTAQDPMAGWKTYANTEFGFEVKYPPTVSAGDRAKNSDLGSVQNPVGGIYVGALVFVPLTPELESRARASVYQECPVRSTPSDDSMPFYCDVDLDTESADLTIRAISVGPEGATARAYISGGATDFYVDAGSEGYESGHGNLTHEEYVRILSSFRFTTPDPMAGWKTYANSEVGFEFKYPPTWIVRDLDISQGGISANPPDFQMPTSGTVHNSFSIAVTAHGYSGEEQPVIKAFGTRMGYVYPKARSVYFPDSQSAGGYIIQLDGPAGSTEPDQILSTFKFY